MKGSRAENIIVPHTASYTGSLSPNSSLGNTKKPAASCAYSEGLHHGRRAWKLCLKACIGQLVHPSLLFPGETEGPYLLALDIIKPSLYRKVKIYMNKTPGGSDGKESASNTGDPSSIPGLGRSP